MTSHRIFTFRHWREAPTDGSACWRPNAWRLARRSRTRSTSQPQVFARPGSERVKCGPAASDVYPGLVPRQVLDDRAKQHPTAVDRPVLRYLDPVYDAEAIAPEQTHRATAGVSHDLSVHRPTVVGTQEVEEGADQGARISHAARIRQYVHVKVRHIARRHRYLPPAVHQYPAEEPARRVVVGSPQAPIERLARHDKVREKLIRLP